MADAVLVENHNPTQLPGEVHPAPKESFSEPTASKSRDASPVEEEPAPSKQPADPSPHSLANGTPSRTKGLKRSANEALGAAPLRLSNGWVERKPEPDPLPDASTANGKASPLGGTDQPSLSPMSSSDELRSENGQVSLLQAFKM